MIDTHVHFWQLDRGDYGWITPERPVLARDYQPRDFQQVISGTPVTGCVAVQAAPSEADTEYLLAQAAEHAVIKGVIGWTDLTSPACAARLDQWQTHSAFKGIRPMAGVQAGPEWLGESHAVGLRELARRDLILEALALPHHVPGIAAIAQSHADLRIIINHAAKPKPDDLAQWAEDMSALSGLETVSCKLSGLTQQSRDPDHQTHVCEVLLDVFGPERLIWGSDHPVLLETATYAGWLARTETLLAPLSSAERTQILQDNSLRVYGLSD